MELDTYLKDLQTPVQEGVFDTIEDILKRKLSGITSEVNALEIDYKNLARTKKIGFPFKWTAEKQKKLDGLKMQFKELDKKGDMIEELLRSIRTNDLDHFLGRTPILFFVLGTAVALTAITWAVHKLYKRFLSDAARSCKGQKGKAKSACMLTHQVRALEKAKALLVNIKAGCKDAKDPFKCKEKIFKKIGKYDEKIDKAKDRIKGLGG